MDESVTRSIYWKKYVEACELSKKYHQAGICPPVSLSKEYDIALEDYRAFLESKNMRMPFPVYIFNKRNYKTWKYLDFEFIDGKKVSCKDRINPNWLYSRNKEMKCL
jgi:hypothetical protein